MGKLRQIPGVGKQTDYANTREEERDDELLKWWNWKD